MSYKVKVELDPVSDEDAYMIVHEDSEFFPVSLRTHSLEQLEAMLLAAQCAIREYELEQE